MPRLAIERGLRRRRIELSVTHRGADGSAAPQFSRRQPMLKTNGLEKCHRPAHPGNSLTRLGRPMAVNARRAASTPRY